MQLEGLGEPQPQTHSLAIKSLENASGGNNTDYFSSFLRPKFYITGQEMLSKIVTSGVGGFSSPG